MCINPDNGECYYNWYAVIDPRGLAPIGFHVPSDEEWDELVNHLGGNKAAGQHLKSEKKWDGSNTSGFSALPAGFRYYDGYFDYTFDGYVVEDINYLWSSSPNGGNAIYRSLGSGTSYVYRYDASPRDGFSVRLIKD
jgi:uncharacterized protein (TIGR02145 family)